MRLLNKDNITTRRLCHRTLSRIKMVYDTIHRLLNPCKQCSNIIPFPATTTWHFINVNLILFSTICTISWCELIWNGDSILGHRTSERQKIGTLMAHNLHKSERLHMNLKPLQCQDLCCEPIKQPILSEKCEATSFSSWTSWWTMSTSSQMLSVWRSQNLTYIDGALPTTNWSRHCNSNGS